MRPSRRGSFVRVGGEVLQDQGMPRGVPVAEDYRMLTTSRTITRLVAEECARRFQNPMLSGTS